MKHTSNKQEFLVIGRATISTSSKRTPGTKDYRKSKIKNNYTMTIHKKNLIHNETYRY